MLLPKRIRLISLLVVIMLADFYILHSLRGRGKDLMEQVIPYMVILNTLLLFMGYTIKTKIKEIQK